MVEVSNKHKNITVGVSSNNGNTIVTAKSDTSQYWANQSHTFADQAKESAQEAKNYAELANSYIEGFENVVTNNTNNIIETGNDYINQLNTTKEEVTEEINATVANGKDEINSTKTTVINDIEFVADGEKKEIEDLIDNGKDELKEAIGDVKVLTTLKIGQIGIAPLGIDETLNMERYLNGQIIIQDQFKGFTNYLKRRVELYPSIACLEDEWQAIVANSDFSQCGKFVIDDNAGTIRLPKIIMPIQGLTDLSKLAEIVEAGLPNITGTFGANVFATTSGAFTYNNHSKGNSGGNNNEQGTATFDASRSSAVYGKSNTVQQEQIQYPYFIQVATGAETEDEITNEHELINPYVLLEPKFFETPVYNLSWLISNGSFTGSKAVHPHAYNALLIELNADIAVGTTQNNYTKRGLPVKLATDSYTDYDFVINPADETFRPPLKVKQKFFNGVNVPVYGDGTALRLYNATKLDYNTNTQMIFRADNGDRLGLVNAAVGQGFAGGNTVGIIPKGNISSGLYADLSSATNNDLYLYFYVGEVAQNTNLVNAGRIEEIKANKTDVDGQWVTKKLDLMLSFPASSTSFDLSEYLPNDGYIYEVMISGHGATSATSGKYISIFAFSDILLESTCIFRAITRTSSTAFGGGTVVIPAQKTITIYNAGEASSGTNELKLVAYRRLGTNI